MDTVRHKPAGYWSRKDVIGILMQCVHKKLDEPGAERRLAALPEGPVDDGDVKYYLNKTRTAVRAIQQVRDKEVKRIMRTLLMEKMI